MCFERELLYYTKCEHLTFLKAHRSTYESTKIYLKYETSKNKANEFKKKLEAKLFDHESVQKFYKNRVINNFEYSNQIKEQIFLLQEEIDYYHKKITQLDYNIDIYKEYHICENEIYRISKRLDELDNMNKLDNI